MDMRGCVCIEYSILHLCNQRFVIVSDESIVIWAPGERVDVGFSAITVW